MQINVNITVAKPAKVVTYANVSAKGAKLRDKPRKERKKYLKAVRRNFCITTRDDIPTLRSAVVTDVPRKRKEKKPEKKEKKERFALLEGEPYTEPEDALYTEPEDAPYTEPEDEEVRKTEAEILEEQHRREEELEDERIFQAARYRYLVPHNSLCSAMCSDTDINLSEISEESGASQESDGIETMSDEASPEESPDDSQFTEGLRSSLKQRTLVKELEQVELVQFRDQITEKRRNRSRSFSEASIGSRHDEDERKERRMSVTGTRRMSIDRRHFEEEEEEEAEEKQPPVMMQYFLFLMFWAFFTNLFAKFKMPFGNSQKQIKGSEKPGTTGRRKSISSRESSLESPPPTPPPTRKRSVSGKQRRVSWVDERDISNIREETEH